MKSWFLLLLLVIPIVGADEPGCEDCYNVLSSHNPDPTFFRQCAERYGQRLGLIDQGVSVEQFCGEPEALEGQEACASNGLEGPFPMNQFITGSLGDNYPDADSLDSATVIDNVFYFTKDDLIYSYNPAENSWHTFDSLRVQDVLRNAGVANPPASIDSMMYFDGTFVVTNGRSFWTVPGGQIDDIEIFLQKKTPGFDNRFSIVDAMDSDGVVSYYVSGPDLFVYNGGWDTITLNHLGGGCISHVDAMAHYNNSLYLFSNDLFFVLHNPDEINVPAGTEIKDGDPYFCEDKDDPAWVWHMNLEKKQIGVENNFVVNDLADNPIMDAGQCYYLPFGYAGVCIEEILYENRLPASAIVNVNYAGINLTGGINTMPGQSIVGAGMPQRLALGENEFLLFNQDSPSIENAETSSDNDLRGNIAMEVNRGAIKYIHNWFGQEAIKILGNEFKIKNIGGNSIVLDGAPSCEKDADEIPIQENDIGSVCGDNVCGESVYILRANQLVSIWGRDVELAGVASDNSALILVKDEEYYLYPGSRLDIDGFSFVVVDIKYSEIASERSVTIKVSETFEVCSLDCENIEFNVKTMDTAYIIGETVRLTDPPEKQLRMFQYGPPDALQTHFVYSDSSTYLLPEYSQKAEINGFIVQLKEKPVTEKKAELEEEIKQVQNEIDSIDTSTVSSFILNTPRELFLVAKKEIKTLNKGRAIRRHKQLVENEHLNFKGALGDVQAGREYSNAFNGFLLGNSQLANLNDIKQLVSRIYPNRNAELFLEDSIPLLGIDTIRSELGYDGRGVTVAVLDTGIDYTHPDLGGCLGDACKVAGGYDFVNNDNDPIDDVGHGTHVAGIIAGDGSASNGRFTGVAPSARLYAYKVCGLFCSLDAILAGMEYSLDPNQDGDFSDAADIVSMSLGNAFGDENDPMSIAADNLVRNGVIVIASAGNSGPEEDTIGSPAISPNVIAVGATTQMQDSLDSGGPDKIAIYSSRGRVGGIKPDVVAPGGDICHNCDDIFRFGIASAYSTYFEKAQTCLLGGEWPDCSENTVKEGESYVRLSGTSMAAPHVSGIVALMKQKSPELTPADVQFILRNTAIDISEPPYVQGGGRVNPERALEGIPMIIAPTSIDLGVIPLNNERFYKVIPVNLRNLLGNEAGPISISLETDGFNAHLSMQSLTLAGMTNAVSELSFDFTPGSNVPVGMHHGAVVIQAANPSMIYKIPITFRVAHVLEVEADGFPQILLQNPEIILRDNGHDYNSFFDDEGRYHALFYLDKPGNYNVVANFMDHFIETRVVFKENIAVSGYKKITIDKSEADKKIEFRGRNWHGDLLGDEDVISKEIKLHYKPLNQDIVGWSFKDEAFFYSSDENNDYRIDIVGIYSEKESRQITDIRKSFENINQGIVLANDPEELIHMKSQYFMGSTPGSVLFGFAAPREIYHGTEFFGISGIVTTDHKSVFDWPFVQHLYYTDAGVLTSSLWYVVLSDLNPDPFTKLFASEFQKRIDLFKDKKIVFYDLGRVRHYDAFYDIGMVRTALEINMNPIDDNQIFGKREIIIPDECRKDNCRITVRLDFNDGNSETLQYGLEPELLEDLPTRREDLPEDKSLIRNKKLEPASGLLTIKVQKYDNSWIDYSEIIHGYEVRLKARKYIALDKLWDENNAFIPKEAGLFRVYAEFNSHLGKKQISTSVFSVKDVVKRG